MRADGRTHLRLAAAVVLACVVLLAPVRCVERCDAVDGTGPAGGCVSSCTTLLGLPAPPVGLWVVVPALLWVVLRLSVRRRRRGRTPRRTERRR